MKPVAGLVVAMAFALVFTAGCGKKADLDAQTRKSGSRFQEPGPSFVAFSLREAQKLAQEGDRSEMLTSLAGLTRIAAMVYDRAHHDFILVGRRIESLPGMHLDDLIIALRAGLVHGQWPLVSIDPTEDTPKTGEQRIRYGGGIQNTGFGRDYVACDVFLKKYSLGADVRSIDTVSTYRSLCMDLIREEAEEQGTTVEAVRWLQPRKATAVLRQYQGKPSRKGHAFRNRFWFCAKDEGDLVIRGDVLYIKALELIVEEEVRLFSEPAGRDRSGIMRPGQRFAQAFTANLDAMHRVEPRLRRLKSLFDLVGVANGIMKFRGADEVRYFVEEYPVEPVPTRNAYDLVSLHALVRRGDGLEHLVRISGGIDLRRSIRWLNDGKWSKLHEIVTRARPADDSLWWELPLSGWEMPNAEGLSLVTASSAPDDAGSTEAPPQSGCSVGMDSVLFDPGKVCSVDDDDYPPPFFDDGGGPPGGGGAVSAFSGFAPISGAGFSDLPNNPVDLGGVKISPEPVSVGEGGTEAKEQTLESRPSDESMSWSIDVPDLE